MWLILGYYKWLQSLPIGYRQLETSKRINYSTWLCVLGLLSFGYVYEEYVLDDGWLEAIIQVCIETDIFAEM